MYGHVKKAALIVFASGAVLIAGQPPAPAPQRVAAHLQGGRRLRRSRRRRHRSARSDRSRTEEGRLPGAGRRQGADDQHLHVRRHSDRACRPPAVSATPFEPDVRTNERAFEGRVYVMIIDDLHARFGRSQRIKSAAKQFIERRLGANDLMAVDSHRGRDQQQPGIHQQQAPAAGGRRQDAGAKARLGDRQQDERVLPHARHPAAGRPAERPGRRGARAQRPQHPRHHQERRGVVLVGSRPPQDDPVPQRRDRLRHQRS